MRRNRMRRGLALLLLLAVSRAAAREVTLVLVAGDGEQATPVANRQGVRKAPFGGWVVATWPAGIQVGEQPVFAYRTVAQTPQAGLGLDGVAPAAGTVGDLLGEPPDGADARSEAGVSADARACGIVRPAEVRLRLERREHLLRPFGIAFSVAADGALASQDPRLRVDADARRLELLCHPVTFKTVVGGRSVPAPLRIACGNADLLHGLRPMLDAFEKRVGPAGGAPAGDAFRRLTLFLPASAPGQPYTVNDVAFTVSADGRVALAANAQARCIDGREIQLEGPASAPARAAPSPAAVSKAQDSVSLFTVRNRGLFRRGDPMDLFWCARSAAERPAGGGPITLAGRQLRVILGQIALPQRQAGGVFSGHLDLDTSALAPGEYEISAVVPGAVCHPLRFRVCQREPLSDYEVYAYVYGKADPCAGSPVNAYYGNIPDAPGLAPVLKEVDASLDASLAPRVHEPGGPAPEKFLRPSPEEARLMALAALGMRAVLPYPTLLYHEDWNPKHTLPEELAQMRRRLALFVQPLADVPGFGGITMGWYATHNGGWWEDVPCQDGNVGRRNAAAAAWVKAQVEKGVPETRAWSSLLPNAWAAYLADVRWMAPGLTAHNAIPSWWLGNQTHFAPYAYSTLTHREAVCYSDYSLTAWGNFRTPAWLDMGNHNGQKLHACFFANTMPNRIVTAFGAAGRGLDGLSMPSDGDIPQGQDESLRRIFERFGSWFSALDPLRDVALHGPDRNALNVALHDLARMRRPAMLLATEDVLAGALARYRVLFLVGARAPPTAAVLDAFNAFGAGGGVIVKDRTCHPSVPGRELGFGYEGAQVHGVWGLAYANGEDEFAHLWEHFKETRERFLVETFARVPGLPVTTADADAVISPLAGSESICCFVVNQTLVPLSLTGRWRQYFVLPKANELRVADGWRVRNLLSGKPEVLQKTAGGRTLALDFSRMEGALFLLTQREPAGMAIRTERTAPGTVRLNGWLADAANRPLADPMPFEVVLRGPEGTVVFRKFAALGPERALDVPVPALSDGAKLELAVRDLVLGSTATLALEPAPPAGVQAAAAADLIGGPEPILAFVRERKGPVTLLLDEGQEDLRAAAEQFAALLRDNGRNARVVAWDPADVRPLPLRWRPTDADRAVLAELAGGAAFAGRVGLGAVVKKTAKTGEPAGLDFDDPDCGYEEYGPRLRHDADIVLFGRPDTNLAVEQLVPYLRRVPTGSYPAAGGFFVHYLWSPFQAGFDGIYVGCRDAAGAAAAVAALTGLRLPGPSEPAGDPAEAPVITAAGAPAPLENLIEGHFGRAVLDIAFTPDGKRVFAAASGLGVQLFALTPDGRVEETREVHHRRGVAYQEPQAPLTARDDRTVDIRVGGTQYRFSLDQGFLSRWSPPAAGFPERNAVRVVASTVLEDRPRARTYLGGRRWLHALDDQGRCLWTHDDEDGALSKDRLLFPRNLYPRAVNADGSVLLATGFGSREMAAGPAQPANPVLLGLDTATGKVLWQKAVHLNGGDVVVLDDGFLVVPDSQPPRHEPRSAIAARILTAATGAEREAPPLKGSAQLRPLPGRSELLVVENDVFDHQGPTARVVLLPLAGGKGHELQVSGRVTDARVATDGQSVLLATARGETLRLALPDGRVLWRAATPSGGILRLAPGGNVLWVGTRDGVLHRLNAATGAPLGPVDLNPYNATTPERFVRQMDAVGDVPASATAPAAPSPPIEPSYRTTLDPRQVPLGANLVAQDGEPGDDTPFRLPVEAGKTYLVELLVEAADPAKLTAQTRLEVVVTGARRTANLPYIGRLPLTDRPARRRLAFRADEAGEVTLTLRAVAPGAVDTRGQADGVGTAPSAAGLRIRDLFVGALGFRGPNLLLDEGPRAKRAPAGHLDCMVFPWTGGSHLVRTRPYDCPQSARRMVNGRIANEPSAWEPSAAGRDVDHATGVVRFRRPQTLTAITVYEDNTGPVLAKDGVRERTAPRYGIYVRKAGGRELTGLGHVADNTQLVNVFAGPPFPVDEIHYVWAGRADADRIDGPVRMTEIEAYADELGSALDAIGDDAAGLDLEP